MTNEITFAKGSITVTIETTEVVENFKNPVIFIRPAQSKDNQASGAKTPKIIDLLMITRSFKIEGHITATNGKTAVQVRDELRDLVDGANTAGGDITMVYGADSITGAIEDLIIKEVRFDEPSTLTADVAKYSVSITFTQGKAI